MAVAFQLLIYTHMHTHNILAPAIINPDGNVTTTIPPGGFEYFQTQCSAYTDTVLVELTDLNGTNFLYVSAIEDNPGPLTENTLSNETTGIRRRTLTLTLPSSSNVSLSVTKTKDRYYDDIHGCQTQVIWHHNSITK